MITRIVKLTFNANYCEEFEHQFPAVRKIVENSKGCRGVQLQKANKQLYFTISKWDDETALNDYRKSANFQEIWSKFKANFSEKPEAWTTEELQQK